MMIPFSRPASAGSPLIPLLAAVLLGAIADSASAQTCGCTGSVQTYCTAGTTTAGCNALMSTAGIPDLAASTGFNLICTSVEGQRYGLVLYGLAPANAVWAINSTSYVCVAPPQQRTGVFATGGASGSCSGLLSMDFNAYVHGNPAAVGAPFQAGQTIYAQAWFRDPGAPKQTNLSNGVRFELCNGTTAPCAPPVLVPIAPGSFQMGSTAAPGAPYYGTANTQPVHTVTITYPFWIGKFEVTSDQYEAAIGQNPSYVPFPGYPVTWVSWYEAREYCARINAQQTAIGAVPFGYEYRLPTEAEWEYVCRAGTTTEFNVGAALYCNQAKIGVSDHAVGNCTNIWYQDPVGSYPPNAWDVHDMHGNVWEWCLDGYSAYTSGAAIDPFSTGSLFRIGRGGSYGDNSRDCRSAERGYFMPHDLNAALGFRVVLGPVIVP